MSEHVLTSIDLALEHPAVGRARRIVFDDDARTLRDQVELTEIPAPPFGEGPRGERIAELFAEAGLEGVRHDAVGNVVADLEEGADEDPVLVTAHLDTIFPEGTEVRVRKENGRLVGPGVSDDGRGLAVLVAVARILRRADVPLAGPVRFVATVGEEGAGDLRGVKHLFSAEGEGRRARGFISLDGAGISRIVTRGLGVRRLRLAVAGPGGHSWADRGTGNPIHALGGVVAELEKLSLPSDPPVGVTAARWGGGTSINAIPREAWVELDLRSESVGYLREAEEEVRRIARGAVAAANASSETGCGPVSLRVEVIGDRPPGATNPDSALVEAAVEATRVVGRRPELVASSTDANIPMARGIPAITMGAGGEAGKAHTPEEWYRNERGPEGVFRALLTLVGFVGLRR